MTAQQIERCAEIGRSFGATKLILFGSSVDSPETARDLDIACEGVDGWELFRFGATLEEEFRIPVDVVPLRPGDRFAEYVAKTGRIVYESR